MEHDEIRDLLTKHFAQVESLADKLDAVRTEDLPAIRVEIEALKIRSSVWGGLSGILGGALAALGVILTKLIGAH